MLHRSSSAQRRKTSRTIPVNHSNGVKMPGTPVKSRRASLATETPSHSNCCVMKRDRSPSTKEELRPTLYPEYHLSKRNVHSESAQNFLCNSLTPDMIRGSRNTLMPHTSLSPRNSLVSLASSRTSLVPDNVMVPRRGSSSSDTSKSPIHGDRWPRGSSIGVPYINEPFHDSLGHSPRGSICPIDCSPDDSIYDDSKAIPMIEMGKSKRPSMDEMNDIDFRWNVPEIVSSRERSSIGGSYDRRSTKASLGLPDPRRSSSDHGARKVPYGQNPDSRRPSSNVSQVSGDESRKLYASGLSVPEKYTESSTVGTITYGSVVFQLKDASDVADTTCEFVFRALGVIYKTKIVSVVLGILAAMSCIMFIVGLKFIKDCPQCDEIPIYMVSWGFCGFFIMSLMLYVQIKSRKTRIPKNPTDNFLSPVKWLLIFLTIFLLMGFLCGITYINRTEPLKKSLYNPNNWCDENFYTFSVIHLYIMYVVLATNLLMAMGLAFYRILPCDLPGRYE